MLRSRFLVISGQFEATLSHNQKVINIRTEYHTYLIMKEGLTHREAMEIIKQQEMDTTVFKDNKYFEEMSELFLTSGTEM